MKNLTIVIFCIWLAVPSIGLSQHHVFNADSPTLNAIIPDFQVNENAGPNGATQWYPSISTDSKGNFIATWVDGRNGENDIYAQRYSNDGSPLGNNFKVNDDQGNADQEDPSVSTDDNGNFVITWEDWRDSGSSVYAQRYSDDGVALGANFKVNDDGRGVSLGQSSISMDGSGNFVITWGDNRGANDNIYAQLYSSDGTALGTNFKVNDDQGDARQSAPSVSTDGSGNFVITWQDSRNGSDWEDNDIYAQRYSSNGTVLGTNFKINDDQGIIKPYQSALPTVTADDSGNFVITWIDSRNGNGDIYAQRFANTGSVEGNNFKVNDDLKSAGQWYPSISTDGSGNFVVVWQGDGNFAERIYAQRYSRNGTALGDNFKVNDDNSYGGTPSISTDSSGNFVVTWMDSRNEYWDWDIYAQRYSFDGSASGTNFKINDDVASSDQDDPCLSTDNNGNFIVAWLDQRNGYYDLYAQRYSRDGTTRGINFQVNEAMGSIGVTCGIGCYPGALSMCTDDNSNFIMTWVDNRDADSTAFYWTDYNIYAHRYSRDGSAVGLNFKVNDTQRGAWDPCISTDGSGNFVITWQDSRSGDGHDIYAQRYSCDGTALGDNFKVNDDQGDEIKWRPVISMNDSGNFVITWQDRRNGDYDIYAQRYSCDGTALGDNFKVNDMGIGGNSPSIATDNSGNFVITWEGDGIFAQRYSDAGVALGANFKVSSVHRGTWNPSISTDGNGNFVITWEDDRNGDFDIYAQRYLSDGTALGKNFMVTNTSHKNQTSSDVKLWRGLIYTTWTDNRAGGTGYDIWANVLDGEFPFTGLEDKEQPLTPSAFMLCQNYPNPFNSSTTIRYSLPQKGFVQLKVYDVLGREIANLVNEEQAVGDYELDFNAFSLTSGVYLYRLQCNDFTETKKLILIE